LILAFELDFEGSTLNKKMDKLGLKMGAMILMYASTKAIKIESTMKKNRPWTDRTNMAKTMLSARVSRPDENLIRITLAHGVDYGIWLELANGKNYAIIIPTVEQEGPRIVEDLNDIMTKIKL